MLYVGRLSVSVIRVNLLYYLCLSFVNLRVETVRARPVQLSFAIIIWVT